MIEYYFLFALAIVYLIVASYEDIKKTEVANWATYSFAVFALAYRAVYSVFARDYSFFVLGVLGFAIFYLIGNALYYAKAFGGADVKLLRGIGVVLPYNGYWGLAFVSFSFVILMFLTAFAYTLIYSIFIVSANKQKFARDFKKEAGRYWGLVVFGGMLGILFLIFSIFYKAGMIGFFMFLFLALMPVLYIYLKAVDSCMIVLRSPREMMEGDWIVKDVKLSRYIVRNTAHGLTAEDIKALTKARKSIYIKKGIPFVPSILISFLVMVFFYLVLKLNFLSLFLF